MAQVFVAKLVSFRHSTHFCGSGPCSGQPDVKNLTVTLYVGRNVTQRNVGPVPTASRCGVNCPSFDSRILKPYSRDAILAPCRAHLFYVLTSNNGPFRRTFVCREQTNATLHGNTLRMKIVERNRECNP